MNTENTMPLWVVYERPLDYPAGFVGRLHLIGVGWFGATERAVFGSTLDEVRQQIPREFRNIGRFAEDEPQIVESWL